MLQRFAAVIGTVLVQAAITIGTAEIGIFAVNRAVDLATGQDQPVLTKLIHKIR